MAAEYARQNNFGLMEVSAKTGSGVKEAFGRLITEVYHQLRDEELENDPDIPKVLVSSGHATSISRPDQVLKGSITLSDSLHYPRKSSQFIDGEENDRF